MDERLLARRVARALPVATLVSAALGSIFGGLSLAILLLAGGTLLGVIALFWASLRVLSGEIDVGDEVASPTRTAADDALSLRKKMLVRALKDLDNEHALGRLEDGDYEELSGKYREDLKALLRRIDDELAPYREKAEALAKEHVGATFEIAAERAASPTATSSSASEREAEEGSASPSPLRLSCPSCQASNEPDARFCKGCAAPLDAPDAPASPSPTEEEVTP